MPVLELKLKTDERRKQLKKAIVETTIEVFTIDIEQAAKAGSPVDKGTNKRSITTEVEEVPQGVSAKIFTQSGYGGYLELGTKKMRARPYLYPAFEQNIGKIIPLAKEKIKE